MSSSPKGESREPGIVRSARGHARIFANFIDQTLESRSQSALCDAMSCAVQALGLRNFAYINFAPKPNADPKVISTYPAAWTSQYLNERYDRHDPVIVRVKRSIEPFYWDHVTPSTSKSSIGRQIFEEAAQHGIRHGFSIPIPSKGDLCAAVSFATDERRPSFEACIGEHGAVLQFMAVLFHYHLRNLAAAMPCQIRDATLSAREFECLEWACRGKSAWEIGQILRISRSTVAFHLGNAKRKLGVRSINQAVAQFVASRPTPSD